VGDATACAEEDPTTASPSNAVTGPDPHRTWLLLRSRPITANASALTMATVTDDQQRLHAHPLESDRVAG
jgi:hypothetical protein